MPTEQTAFEAARRRKGWTYEKLAAVASVSLGAAYRVCKGQSNAVRATAAIADVLGLDAAETAIAIADGDGDHGRRHLPGPAGRRPPMAATRRRGRVDVGACAAIVIGGLSGVLAFLSGGETVSRVVDAVSHTHAGIVLFTSGMATNVAMARLIPIIGDAVSMHDIGATLDPYVGINSRGAYRKDAFQAVLARTLEALA